MKMRDRWGVALVTVCLCLLFAGCGRTEKESTTEVATETAAETTPEEGTTGNILTETEGVTDVTVEGMSRDILKNMTLEEKIGQMLFVGLDSLRAEEETGDLTECSKTIEENMETWTPGGIILYGKNMETTEQVQKLTEDLQNASRIPLFLGTEEEGGENGRIASEDKITVEETQEEGVIGESGETEQAEQTGQIIGSYMKDLGLNLDFAPVADVADSEENQIIGNRSYGSDVSTVSDLAAAFVTGIQGEGVSAVLKYFPGQGSLTTDTKKGAADITKTIKELRNTEFKPFSAGIKAGVDVIMVGHASVSPVTENQTPASLSSLMISEILRNELQFDSIVITDSMNMKAITDNYTVEEVAVKAVEAGADMILCPGNGKEAYKAIKEAVENGKISEKRLNESVLRILKVKIKREIIPEDTDLIPTEE
jgi:beta-N-acetylhexosaminidase